MENELTQILIEPISESMIAVSEEMRGIADAREEEWATIAAAKESASAKLTALGLTDDEIKSIIGGV